MTAETMNAHYWELGRTAFERQAAKREVITLPRCERPSLAVTQFMEWLQRQLYLPYDAAAARWKAGPLMHELRY